MKPKSPSTIDQIRLAGVLRELAAETQEVVLTAQALRQEAARLVAQSRARRQRRKQLKTE